MITTMIILFIIYILSVFGAYKLLRKQYSKGGSWDLLSPNLTDIFMVIVPVFNTCICILLLDTTKFISVNTNNFFKIKK